MARRLLRIADAIAAFEFGEPKVPKLVCVPVRDEVRQARLAPEPCAVEALATTPAQLLRLRRLAGFLQNALRARRWVAEAGAVIAGTGDVGLHDRGLDRVAVGVHMIALAGGTLWVHLAAPH